MIRKEFRLHTWGLRGLTKGIPEDSTRQYTCSGAMFSLVLIELMENESEGQGGFCHF